MLSDKLIHHFPGASWNMTGEDYNSLEWFGPGSKPTEAEIMALPKWRSIEEAKKAKQKEIDDLYSAKMEAAASSYPQVERETWGKQEAEARAWKGNGQYATPFIDGMRITRPGKAKQDMVDSIIAKADALADISGQLTGKRHRLEEEIQAATDIPAVEAVTW